MKISFGIQDGASVMRHDPDTDDYGQVACPECHTSLVWGVNDEEPGERLVAECCPGCGWSSGWMLEGVGIAR